MADPIPNAGTQTDPAEFRRLLSRIFTPGVVSGLTLTAGTGLAVNVAAGNAAVGDANSITFLPFTATTPLTGLAPNATTTVYASYRTTGDLQAYLSTAVPATPYEVVGTVTTSATGVTSVDNTTAPSTTAGRRHQSEFPASVGRYVTTAQRIEATAFGINVGGVMAALPDAPVYMPLGARLGNTTQPTKRFFVRAHRTTTFSVPDSTWTGVPFNLDQVLRTDYTDPALYPKPPHNDAGSVTEQRRFYAGPAGVYQFSARLLFEDPAGANVGRRYGRVIQYNAAGDVVWTANAHNEDVATNGGNVYIDLTMDLPAGNYVEFTVMQTQGVAVNLFANNYSAGTPCWATMTLLQVA
jgi:hypothetical protein